MRDYLGKLYVMPGDMFHSVLMTAPGSLFHRKLNATTRPALFLFREDRKNAACHNGQECVLPPPRNIPLATKVRQRIVRRHSIDRLLPTLRQVTGGRPPCASEELQSRQDRQPEYAAPYLGYAFPQHHSPKIFDPCRRQ